MNGFLNELLTATNRTNFDENLCVCVCAYDVQVQQFCFLLTLKSDYKHNLTFFRNFNTLKLFNYFFFMSIIYS